jgi:hypothetical protein
MGYAQRLDSPERRQARATARLKDLAGTIADEAHFDRILATVRPHMRVEVRRLLRPLLAFPVATPTPPVHRSLTPDGTSFVERSAGTLSHTPPPVHE